MLLFFAFFSGVLSVLAPCVLPLLPVILGTGMTSQHKENPYLVLLSALVCIFLFTLLLKLGVGFINLETETLNGISAIIIILYAITLLFPQTREYIKRGLPFSPSIKRRKTDGKFWGDLLLGASLGPLFASCSPTYALIISIILPQNLWRGIINIATYIFGFGLMLLLIIIFGRSLIQKFSSYADSEGSFKKVLGILLLITGILILTGGFKYLETQLAKTSFALQLIKVEKNNLQNKLLPDLK
ncbi:MAG: hypothetical protein DLD55_04950 [candidate division SR1 bacterium]|nr:MAG: hypothetical protein DLD55_04950 [candidate division SR1 bacterium]